MKNILLLIFIITYFNLFGISDPTDLESKDVYYSKAESLVSSLNPNYVATPGDTYNINFTVALGQSKTITCFIDEKYTIKLGYIGEINVQNMNYKEVKAALDRLISQSYPDSFISVFLGSVGQFNVVISGEISKTMILNVTGITRLTDMIEPLTASLSSNANIRDIEIISSNNKIHSYDLFKFYRDADLDNNPYLRPNDNIRINKYKKKITISGAINRPGSYILNGKDTLYDAITIYGDDFTPLANRSQIEIERVIDENTNYKESTFFINKTLESLKTITLENYDIITINNMNHNMNTVTVRGALIPIVSELTTEMDIVSPFVNTIFKLFKVYSFNLSMQPFLMV